MDTVTSMGKYLACLLITFAFQVSAEIKPVLTITFDKDFNAVDANGGIVAGTVVDKPELAPGKTGQALKSGPNTGYVNFPAELLKKNAGTVEMWVCPIDWQPGAKEFHVFFETQKEGALYLYKYFESPNLLMLSCPDKNGPYFESSSSLMAWKPGEWHHIAGTWSPDGVRCYVDGELGYSYRKVELPKKLGDIFRIGDHPWHITRASSSLIDEVRIYDRELSSAYFAAHAAGDYSFAGTIKEFSTLDAKFATLRYDLDAEKYEIHVRAATGGVDVSDAELRVKIGIVEKDAALADAVPDVIFSDGQALQTLAVDREVGHHQVVAKFFQNGKEVFELRKALIIPDTASWLGNSLGKEDKVLPPWTPLEVKERTVNCWGRTYTFNENPLPEKITSAGQEISGQCVVKVKARGEWLKQNGADVNISGDGSVRRTIDGRIQYKLDGGTLALDIKGTIEYDGLLWCEITCNKPEEIQALSIELPMDASHVLYRHCKTSGVAWSDSTGALPPGEGVIDQGKFRPYYWLGDNDRGLFWFCESDEMWPNGQNGNALEVERGEKTVVLRLNILAEGQKFPATWKYAFGLQATPVKPLPKDRHKWRLSPAANATVKILWPVPNKHSTSHYGYPEAANPELFAKVINELHEKKIGAMPYLCLTYLSAGCPEWPFFKKDWATGYADDASSDVIVWGNAFAEVSAVGKNYADFIVWKTAQFIKQFGIDGLYHDNSSITGTDNRLGGAPNLTAGYVYLRDGKVCSKYPILGMRDLYRRMYSVMKSIKPDSFSMAHMSGSVTIPFVAYDDAYLSGELFRTGPNRVKESYLDCISLDTFRAEFMGRQWGIMPYFIPQFEKKYREQIEPTRGLMALLMLHDVNIWPEADLCNLAVVNEAFAALDAFDYLNADFLPYFDPIPPASTQMKDVYVSGYRRADGSVLLIVGNLAKEDREGFIILNERALGMTNVDSVISWPDKAPLLVKERSLTLRIPRLGYRMLVVSPPPLFR